MPFPTKGTLVMPEAKKTVTRIDSALNEQRELMNILALRCCQHAGDTGEARNERDAALAAVAERDKRIAELEAEVAALKAPSSSTSNTEQAES